MNTSRQRPPSPVKVLSPTVNEMSPQKGGFTSHTTELFVRLRGTAIGTIGTRAVADNTNAFQNNLQITDTGTTSTRQAMPPPNTGYRPPRPENVPPPMNGRSAPGHLHSYSQEEEMRLRNGGKQRGAAGGLDIFADPPRKGRLPEVRRPRRNSESSLVERSGTLAVPDEDRRRRERRLREREARYRDAKGRLPPFSSKSKKPNQRLDIIDKLDVTSIYGTGCEFTCLETIPVLSTRLTHLSIPP